MKPKAKVADLLVECEQKLEGAKKNLKEPEGFSEELLRYMYRLEEVKEWLMRVQD